MRIAIVSLNGMPCNGETYFAIDLCAGLNRIGHICDLISLNFMGKKNSSDVQDGYVKYIKYKDIDKLNEYDFVYFNCGRFKSDYHGIDFSLLKSKTGLAIHNCSSFKTYNLEVLCSKIKFDLFFSNDLAVSDICGKKAFVLTLPFDTAKPKAIHGAKHRIIVPTRFTFAKYIKDVAKTLKELNADQTAYFYGKEGFYFNVIKRVFDDSFKYEFLSAFKSDIEKAERVYKDALIAFDGSNFKIKGNRVQMVQLECFHHEVVPCMRRTWFNESFKEGINGVALEDKEAIKKVINDGEFRNSIIENNKSMLEKHRCENVAKEFIKIIEDN